MIKEYCDKCGKEITNYLDNENITIPYKKPINPLFQDIPRDLKITYKKKMLCKECAIDFVSKITHLLKEEIPEKPNFN